MNSRKRVLMSQAHKEPDKVPLFDLAFSRMRITQKMR